MLGWASRIPRLASRRSLAMALTSRERVADNTLIATLEPLVASLARYTNDIPPSPSFFRISYRPSSMVPTRLRCITEDLAATSAGSRVGDSPVSVAAKMVTRRVPSRVQKRASVGYVLPQDGHRFVTFAPGSG